MFRKKPVYVLEDLIQADKEIAKSESKPTSIILINCGGNVSIDEVMPNIPETTMVFVIDSHRPYNRDNILDESNIMLFGAEDTNSEALEDNDDKDSEEEKEEDGYTEEGSDEPPRKKRKQKVQTLDDISSFYGTSAAMIGFQIAEAVGKQSNNDILWWTIIGFTDQFIHHKISLEKFVQGIIKNGKRLNNYTTYLFTHRYCFFFFLA